jgi:hypothetical protein
MLGTIQRMWFGATLFDRTMMVIELLVLLLIAYEVFGERLHRWKIHRRIANLRGFLASGQQIQADAVNAAHRGAGEDTPRAWARRVTEWMRDTDAQLKSYSLQASLSFHHDPGAMFHPFVSDSFHPAAKEQYLRLQHCLNNLHQIIERPDVYL